MSKIKKKHGFLDKQDLEEIREIKKTDNKKSPLNKDKIIMQIAAKNDIDKKLVEKILRDFFLTVFKHAKKYGYVSFYGFGKFKTKNLKSKKVKVPYSNNFVRTRPKKYITFISSFEV